MRTQRCSAAARSGRVPVWAVCTWWLLGDLEIIKADLRTRVYAACVAPDPCVQVGEEMGQNFTTVHDGHVLGGVGLDLQQEGRGPVYVVGRRAGGPAALCKELRTEHGVQRGEIESDDVLLAVDGEAVKVGVNSDATLKAVRKGILGPLGTGA